MSDGMSSVASEAVGVIAPRLEGAVIAGFDVHLRQITFDCLDSVTGEVRRGRIGSSPSAVREWAEPYADRVVHVAMEACTGWLFVARALDDAGAIAHLAETVETRALRGRKRRAKTDRQDALWLRELLAEGRLPEAWMAPEHVRQWRSRLHLRKALIDERTQWLLRIRSVLYHHGLSAGAPGEIANLAGRTFLARLDLPLDARERVTVALGMIDILECQIADIERSLRRVARHQTGCQALMTQFGVGELIALTLVTELGDVCRMTSSRKAVRFAGLDIGVHRSDQTARVGKLTRQGSSPLRWALYEAAQSATRLHSPDYRDYHALRDRGLTHTRASLTIARKIARRSYHLLHNLGPDAIAPTPD
ncbi:MAG: IS110 family transposase [Solirubrobacteraceae bacterium]